jgi:hypothetical protein
MRRWRVLEDRGFGPTWALLKWVETKVGVGALKLLPKCDGHLRPST